MAWLDDRIWCHTKLVDLSDRAFRVYIHGIAYAAGFGTRGVLTAGQQRTIGGTKVTRAALVAADLWHELPGGAIAIHDWDDHNGKRDARRARDRERKRLERHGEVPQDRNGDSPQDRDNVVPGKFGGTGAR